MILKVKQAKIRLNKQNKTNKRKNNKEKIEYQNFKI